MKGDFTRFTFNSKKHYSGVRMQQGRVLLDSDWNEQADIFDHRTEIEVMDIIGRSGCPADQAGFAIAAKMDDLTVEERDRLTEEEKESFEALDLGDFVITAGRYYVDGILCENEQAMKYADQRHKPKLLLIKSSLMEEIYSSNFPPIVYLDVWKRHVSAIEDPEIRETALGGPDTTTRIETAWQVRTFMPEILGEVSNECIDVSERIPTLSNGRLTVKLTSPAATKASKCSMAPRGGYQGLENRLYRVEIHDSGRPFGWPRYLEGEENTGVCGFDYPILSGDKRDDGKDGRIVVEDSSPDGLSWRQGQMVEIFVPGTEEGTLARVEEVKEIKEADEEKTQLKLNLDISNLGLPEDLKIHRVATFKWSRDNGSVAYPIESFPEPAKVKVKSLGRDRFLSLRGGDCVEVLGDATEFRCEPGTMAIISDNGADEANRELILKQDVSRHKDEANPKIRRWDRSRSSSSEDIVSPITLDQAELEDGIVVQFSVGPGNKDNELPSTIFRTGDYWTFPARSTDGKLKELKEAPPEGIEHHYACLGLLSATRILKVTKDCRRIFQPLTAASLPANILYYVGGDGQDGLPGWMLPLKLQVGVADYLGPVSNVSVKFIANGGGKTKPSDAIKTVDGIAECYWTLGSDGKQQQQVEAYLVDSTGKPIVGSLPVRFSANFDRLAELRHVSSDNQEVMLDLTKPVQPIEVKVQAVNDCGPVAGASVLFNAPIGKADPIDNGMTDKYGIASCNWLLSPDANNPVQILTAILDESEDYPIHKQKNSVTFKVRLNVASNISYDPASCPKLDKLQGVTTVQDAINRLCPANILYAVSGNGQVGKPGDKLTLKAVVVDSRGPVPGVPVQFRVLLPMSVIEPVTVETRKDGVAAWDWTLGNLPTQQVEASILDSDKKPVGLPVQFNAILNVADCIWYDPKSYPFMQNYNTVQEALDRLCSDQSDFNITGVQVLADDGKMRSFDNGATIRADLLVQGGLTISCSEKVDPTSFRGGDLRTPVCMVSIEEPYFSPHTESFFGYHQLTLLGDAYVRTKDAPSLIIWESSIEASDILSTLSDYCLTLSRYNIDKGLILAHLVIKGNFIRSAENPDKYLDGDSFAIRPTTSVRPSNSFFPSGDGRAGGNFEMWFWISEPMKLNIMQIPDIELALNALKKVEVSITVNNPPPINLVINLSFTNTEPKIIEFLDLPKSIIIKQDEDTASFSFSIKRKDKVSEGTYLTISAALARWNVIRTEITANLVTAVQ